MFTISVKYNDTPCLTAWEALMVAWMHLLPVTQM